MTESQQLKQRKAEFRRRLRAVEKAALGCLAPAPAHDLIKDRQRTLDKKAARATELSQEFLLEMSKIDRKLGKAMQQELYRVLVEWEAKEQERVTHYGDLRSLPR